MQIAIASGKGGTGKTTLAVNLALAWGATQFLDCDVEAPNAYHFLKPQFRGYIGVFTFVPVFNPGLCSGCGECVAFCRYHALAIVKKQVLLFPELCHGCGGCRLVCPTGAIRSGEREIGVLRVGAVAGGMVFSDGLLEVGNPSGVPLIRKMKKRLEPGRVIVDCPPGSACAMKEAVNGAEYCLLVTEPTPFGLHDLQLAVATVLKLGIPAGVVLNRDGSGESSRVEEYCARAGLPVLLKIPESREIAASYAQGVPLIETLPQWREKLRGLGEKIATEVKKHAATSDHQR